VEIVLFFDEFGENSFFTYKLSRQAARFIRWLSEGPGISVSEPARAVRRGILHKWRADPVGAPNFEKFGGGV
jgi:hypothetical protein